MLHEDPDVLTANAAFYRAFADRDLDAMDALWARSARVACIHPGWRALHGRDAVMESWRSILGSSDAPDIVCSGESVIPGETVAVVLCVESLRGGSLAATNVFVREGGEWRIVHHHAGPIAPGGDTGGDAEPPRFLN
ncbi:MAG: nuclear transport factor 2 family protein [Deltaproteobacteria bacterium]|nr:nuclear transport factor 2 family protein [Deltaproteobacteria bacterium]